MNRTRRTNYLIAFLASCAVVAAELLLRAVAPGFITVLLFPTVFIIVWLAGRGLARNRAPEYPRLSDVTEQRRAQEELRRTAALLEEAQKIAHVGGWEVDVPTGSLYWTTETYRIHDTSPEEYKPTLETGIQFYAPESVPIIKEAVRKAMHEGKAFFHELELITAKGRRIWVETTSRVVREGNRAVKIYGAFRDITELKQADAALRGALRRAEEGDRILKTLMDNVPEGITLAEGPDVKLTAVSRHGQEMLAHPHAGMTISEYNRRWTVYAPDGNTQLSDDDLPLSRAVKRGETLTDVEIVQVAADRKRLHLLCNAAPVRNEAGQVTGGVVVWRDITERKKMEASLRISERRFRRLYETKMIGLTMGDIEGRIYDANDAFLEMIGRSREDLGKGINWKEITPEEFSERDHQAFEELRRNGYFHAYEKGFLRKDGTVVPVLLAGGTIDEPQGANLLVVFDITQRKANERKLQESESRLRAVLESLPVGVFIADPAGQLTHANVAATRIWGQSPLLPMDQYREYKAWWPESGRRLEAADWAISKAIQRGEETKDEVLNIEAFDGSRRIISNNATPVRGAKGENIGAVSVIQDITDKRRLELAKDEAIRARDEVIGIVSHDLRNPLGAIKLSAALLEKLLKGRADFGDVVIQQTRRIQKVSERMNRLISDLLDLTRIEGGRFELHPKVCGAGTIISATLEELKPLLEEKGVRIQEDSRDESHALICDIDRISQVFGNLIGNAIKFVPERSGVISVKVRSENEEIVFSVGDNGPGISPEEVPHVFDRFWHSKKSENAGAGLGLAIAKGIVEAHCGRIWVESRPGEGAVFHFTLPRPESRPGRQLLERKLGQCGKKAA